LATYRAPKLQNEYEPDRVEEELQKLERALEQTEGTQFVVLHRPPIRPRDGLTVFADGSDWDPGSGQGVYTFYNNAWNKLG
jgi:hypothetical protein